MKKSKLFLGFISVLIIITISILLLKWFHRSIDSDRDTINLKVCYGSTPDKCSNLLEIIGHPAQNYYLVHVPAVHNLKESWGIYHNSHETKNDDGGFAIITNYPEFKSSMDISIFDSEPVKQLKMLCATSFTESNTDNNGCKKLINIKSLDGIKYQANFYNNDALMRRIVVQPSEDGKGYIGSYQNASVFEKE